MINLYQDPEGEKVFEKSFSSAATKATTVTDILQDTEPEIQALSDPEKVSFLESQLNILENTFQEKNNKLTELQTLLDS